MKEKHKQLKKRIFDIIQIGNVSDLPSRLFDIFITVIIAISLVVTILTTYDELGKYRTVLDVAEIVTVVIFTVEYILRIWTSEFRYPKKSRLRAALKFIFSVEGLIDLFTFLPFYLPIVFPAGAVAFRVFRVIRIFRLFKLNQRYDAFSIITDVLNEKKKQLFSSMVMILILMVASSLCMYSLEHEAQPEVFKNAFSGIWWASSTLLTIGYGDIYPITLGGKIMAIVISFLGVGMVAVPTGIISAGFVESYSKIHRIVYMEEERPIRFLTSTVGKNHKWVGKRVKELIFPPETILAAVIRDEEEIVPKGDTEIRENDVLILGAKKFYEDDKIKLTDLLVKERHEWVGMPLKKVPISRQSLIVLIRRNNRNFIPDGDTVINAGDELIIYQKEG
jgi:voltage-gated potassium channel